MQRDGSSATMLEITGSKGAVQVNGKIYPRNTCVTLCGGDEVVFSTTGNHAYVSFFCLAMLGSVTVVSITHNSLK